MLYLSKLENLSAQKYAYNKAILTRFVSCLLGVLCTLTAWILFYCISNKMQRYTVYFIWKLLYMFRVVPPPIIRSAKNCIYSIWYLSDRYCYLPLQRQIEVTV
jgi:hypothetical protein